MDSNDGQKPPSVIIPTIALNDEPLEIPDASCTEGNSCGLKQPPPPYADADVSDLYDGSTLSPYSAVDPELAMRGEIAFPDNISMGSMGSAALRLTPRSQLRTAFTSFLGMHLPDADRVSLNNAQTTATSKEAHRPRGCWARCASAPWAWICWVTLIVLVFILNPFGAVMIVIEACAGKSSGTRKRVCRVLQFTAGIVGILVIVAILLYWRLALASDDNFSAAGIDFKYRSGPCSIYTCCSQDSIYYDGYCYWDPVTPSSCQYIVQWTCNSDCYFPDVCGSDRCCRRFAIFYERYCYYNASGPTSPSSSVECRYTVERACYRGRYFSYSSNGCPSSALYYSDSYCYYN